MRSLWDGIRRLQNMPDDELMSAAKELNAPYNLVRRRRNSGACRCQLLRRRRGDACGRRADDAVGRRGRVRGLGNLQERDPAPRGAGPSSRRSRTSTTGAVAEASRGLGEPMSGIAVGSMAEEEKLAKRAGRAAQRANRCRGEAPLRPEPHLCS